MKKQNMGLFEYWLEIERAKGTQKEAIRKLNDFCGTKYVESWPSKMASRDYSLERTPTNVRRYMMRIVLPEIFPGKSNEEYEMLVLSLT